MKKYGNENVWRIFTEVFQYLPLAATIKGEFFCLHGGLSPTAQRIDQIKHINRVQEIPQEGIMCDLMWSDPEEGRLGFGKSPRQVGYIWGVDETEKFCHTNNLRMICRAHQLVMEGYNEVHNKQCVTVFSAPNYCYRCNNLASIVEIDDLLNANYQQYEPAPRENEPRAVKRVPSYFL